MEFKRFEPLASSDWCTAVEAEGEETIRTVCKHWICWVSIWDSG